MARTLQFTIGASRTINLGNYESMRIEASLVVAPDELDDLAVVKRQAQLDLRNLLEETWKAQHRKEQQK